MGVATNKKVPSASANAKDKSDRATSEQVLDPRTRLILFKMIGRGLIQEVNGCVSTGKEVRARPAHLAPGSHTSQANVYHALAPDGAHLALKIFKTSILVFKDRDKYVAGEYRFRRGYNRHNPRKMVRLWAEKEMRNLKRLVAAGLPAPTPIEVRENVLVMSFLGDAQGWCVPIFPSRAYAIAPLMFSDRASPRLKDAEIAPEAAPALYAQLVRAVRTMFHACRLVHADLSEYNVLLHAGAAHVIDVSQAVEHDHPHAFDFLRADGARRCFEFVVRADVCVPEDGGDEARALERWIAETPQGEEREQDDEVFLKSYIPRTLNEVFDPERDVEKLGKGEGDKLIYADTIGLVAPGETKADTAAEPKAVRFEGAEDEDGEGEGSGGDNDDDGSEDEEEEDPFKPKPARGHRNEDKDAKKVHIVSHSRLPMLTAPAGTEAGRQSRSTRTAKDEDAQGGEEEEDQEHRPRLRIAMHVLRATIK
jgi:RIO kinase 1